MRHSHFFEDELRKFFELVTRQGNIPSHVLDCYVPPFDVFRHVGASHEFPALRGYPEPSHRFHHWLGVWFIDLKSYLVCVCFWSVCRYVEAWFV